MADLRGGSTVGGYTILTTGTASALLNTLKAVDGAGSGLDADLLDGMAAATANTASTIVYRDASGNFSAGTITATLSGNASTATKLAAARTIALTGAVTGSATFDGSANTTITTTMGNVTGSLQFQNTGIIEFIDIGGTIKSDGWFLIDIDNNNDATGDYFRVTKDNGGTVLFNVAEDGSVTAGWNKIWHEGNDGSGSGLDADLIRGLYPAIANTGSTIVQRDSSGNFSAGTITASLAGNASSADKLSASRNIGLTGAVTGDANFDGSGDLSITTSISSVPWASITGEPTTVAGYGITNAMTTSHAANAITGFGTSAAALGTAAAGTATTISRSDHVHPTTGLMTTSHAANAITGLSATTPAMNGTATIGTATTVARADHIHPTDTSRAATGQTMYIGTTAVTINRASAALALTGITSIDGNAATATKLATARTISLTGNVTGSVSFDGSANASMTTTVASAPWSAITSAPTTLSGYGITDGVNKNGDTISGSLFLNGEYYYKTYKASDTEASFISGWNNGNYFGIGGQTGNIVKIGSCGADGTWYSGSGNEANLALEGTINATGTVTAPTFIGALSGNATTATSASKLTTARKINGVSFDGTADITISASSTFTTDITVNGLTVGRGAGNNSTNTALGASALVTNVSGGNNVAIGNQAMYTNKGSKNVAVGDQALYKNSAGANNVAIGYNALLNANTSKNVAIGDSALYTNLTGGSNTAIGYCSLFLNKASKNTAIGDSALYTNVWGECNVAIGYNSLYTDTASYNVAIGDSTLLSNTSGQGNVAIGHNALMENTTGNESVAVGYNALLNNTTWCNTAVGAYALQANTTGSGNTGIGYSSLYANTTGYGNTALGHNALYTNITGFNNVSIGYESLKINSSGNSNVAIGRDALKSNNANSNIAIGALTLTANTTGSGNVAIGDSAMYTNTTGSSNTALGNTALNLNTIGNYNTAVGNRSLFNNTTGSSNVAIGDYALTTNSTSSYNVAIGAAALMSNATGNSNTAIGHNALNYSVTGKNNTAVGYQALYNDGIMVTAGNFINGNYYTIMIVGTTDFTAIGASANTVGTIFMATGPGAGNGSAAPYNTGSNTAVGYQALYSNFNGVNNVGIGMQPLYKNVTGAHNIAIGRQALYNNDNAYYNTAIGSFSLQANIDGAYNTAIGYQSLNFNTTGSNNIAIGYQAGTGTTTGGVNITAASNCVYIGANTQSIGTAEVNTIVIGNDAASNGSNTVTIGNDNITDTYLKGTVHGNIDIAGSKDNFIIDGLEVSTSPTALLAGISAGKCVIDGKYHEEDSQSMITVGACRNSIIYASKSSFNNSPQFGTLDAVLPEPDDNTVAQWIFNTAGTISNYAVGKSAIAVANDLTAAGTLTKVDGWVDYAIQGNGSTGYYTSANLTGVPTGASEREINILFTPNQITAAQTILAYGAATTGNEFLIGLTATGTVKFTGASADTSTISKLAVGEINLLTVQYTGTLLKIYINGQLQISAALTLNTTTTNKFNILRTFTPGEYSNGIVHFVEIRNKIRTPDQISEICNKLFLEYFYKSPIGSYPNTPTDTGYHEWKFDETSGTTVADSNTTSAKNGTATGTVIIDSGINLGKARRFNGTSDIITCATTSWAKSVTIIAVANAYLSNSNRYLCAIYDPGHSANFGFVTSNSGGGIVGLRNGSTFYSSGAIAPLNKTAFYAVSINNLSASFYVDSPNIAATVAVSDYSGIMGALEIGSSGAASTYFSGEIDYLVIIPRALSQAEIKTYYNKLMKVTIKDIKSLLPANSISLGYVRTNSTSIIDFDSSSYKWGIRYTDNHNKKVKLDYKLVAASSKCSWDNPFGELPTKCISVATYPELAGLMTSENAIDTTIYTNQTTISGENNSTVNELHSAYLECLDDILK